MSVFGGNSDIQKDYTWEIRNIEDANEWIENIEMDSMFHFNEIKNSKGNVYQVITEKQAYLKSNRLIKDLESANQWIADLGYEGAIRFNYDGGKLWTVELLIDNEWKQYERVESCQKALEYVCGLILPKADMPEIAVGIDKNKVALIDSLETANQWLQSLEKGENYKFVYRKNPNLGNYLKRLYYQFLWKPFMDRNS